MQNDVTYLAIMVGLFVLMFALVGVCDRIIGSDEQALEDQGGGDQGGGDQGGGDQSRGEPDQLGALVQTRAAA